MSFLSFGPNGIAFWLVTMTTLSLILMAVSAASVLAESTVYFREQFEDAGEDFPSLLSYFDDFFLKRTCIWNTLAQ